MGLVMSAAPASAYSVKAPPLQFPWRDNTGQRIHGFTYDCGHTHQGIERYAIDFGLPIGTPVTAAASGRVYRQTQTEGGNGMYVLHGNGFVSTYWHLQSWVAVNGQWVNQGQVIAYAGKSGTWSGNDAHLHFSVHKNGFDAWSGEAHIPEPLFGPYRGGNGGFGAYGSCAGGDSPVYTSKPGCPSGASTTVFNRASAMGYYQVAHDGGVFAFGDAPFFGSMGGSPLNSTMTGMARTYDHQGYWEVGADGGIFAFGNAPFHGSAGDTTLVSCIQGMAARPNGQYWLAAADGGVFAYPVGVAPFYGSMGGQPLAARIQGMAATPDGGGYWLLGADGGIFSFGNASFYGSLAGQAAAPAMSMASSPTGRGYWILLADGTVVGFGDAANLGSVVNPYTTAIGISPTVNGDGYWVSLVDGQIHAIGNASDEGGLYGTIQAPANGVVGLHGQQPDFTIGALPGHMVVPPGASAESTITVTANPYFQGTISLSTRGVPSGVTATLSRRSFSLNQNQAGTSTLKVTRSVSSFGSFTMTVTACGNGVCHSVPVTVN